MDIYHYLQKDHKKVSDLFTSILSTTDQEKRKELFEEVIEELLVHSKTEEATFYKAIENAGENPKEKITVNIEENMEEAHDEHDEIRKYIKILSKLPIESEEWIEKLGEFKHSVEHHVKEEEETIFQKAKKILSKEEENGLALEMETLKEKERNKNTK